MIRHPSMFLVIPGTPEEDEDAMRRIFYTPVSLVISARETLCHRTGIRMGLSVRYDERLNDPTRCKEAFQDLLERSKDIGSMILVIPRAILPVLYDQPADAGVVVAVLDGPTPEYEQI